MMKGDTFLPLQYPREDLELCSIVINLRIIPCEEKVLQWQRNKALMYEPVDLDTRICARWNCHKTQKIDDSRVNILGDITSCDVYPVRKQGHAASLSGHSCFNKACHGTAQTQNCTSTNAPDQKNVSE